MFKSISSLILFQNPRPGFQVPNLTLLSITYCSSNFQLCCKLLTTAYVLKLFRFEKKIILFLFVFHWVLLYFFPNKYPDPCQNRPGYSLVEEPITYACNFEKKNTIFGFSNHAKASEFCFRFRPFYYTTCLFLKSMYSIFVRSGGTHFSGYWHLLEATCLYLMC